jgi:hypothetical protein
MKKIVVEWGTLNIWILSKMVSKIIMVQGLKRARRLKAGSAED